MTTLKSGDGALLGRHRVTIEARRVTGRPDYKSFSDEIHGVRKGNGARFKTGIVALVPDKYSRRESSPLTAEVKKGENRIDSTCPANRACRRREAWVPVPAVARSFRSCGKSGAMPTLAVGTWPLPRVMNMPTASVGMAPVPTSFRNRN